MLRAGIQLFTIVQLLTFAGALTLFPEHWLLSFLMVVLAGLLLNFSLHITVHHFVHFRSRYSSINFIVEIIYSLTLALPYTFYKIQHYNHHRYDNRLGDFTSTWIKANDQIVPKHLLRYVFFWWIPTQKGILKRAEEDGDLQKGDKIKMGIQLLLILAVYPILFIVNPIFPVFYALMFYMGWSLVALTNFGQHLPITYGKDFSYSYLNKLYNRIFFNNGLHYEHHKNPQLNYNKLKDAGTCELKMPHLPAGIFGNEAVKST